MVIEFSSQKPNKKTGTPIIGSNWSAIQKKSGKRQRSLCKETL